MDRPRSTTAGERERGRDVLTLRLSGALSSRDRERERSCVRPGDLERVRDRGSLTCSDIGVWVQGPWLIVGWSPDWRCVYLQYSGVISIYCFCD